MFTYFNRQKKRILVSSISRVIVCALSLSLIFAPAASYAQSISLLNLPSPGTMITPSISYAPATMAGMTIHPDNPLQFDFIIDVGDDNLQGDELRKESEKLINYFMATLTVPEDEMWVNLSPYEKERIIADGLGNTLMGRDMLAQDYILKQLTASMMYPEDKLGSEFWQRVYKKAQDKLGTTEIPTDTFNKIWIIPEEAVIYANGTNIFIADSRLKVMLEEDYLALENHDKGLDAYSESQDMTQDTKAILKEVLLPEIEREVNEGKNFAPLRQIYHSMILATWYKNNLKESLLGKVYVDQNKVEGIDVKDKDIKNKIYNQYVEAFKKGVYNYIREDYDEATKEVIPRKYFSGGEYFARLSDETMSIRDSVFRADWIQRRGNSPKVRVRTQARLGQSSSPVDGTKPDIDALRGQFGDVVHQPNDDVVFLKQSVTFTNSQRDSEVGTMIAHPKRIRFDVRVLANAQGNLSIYDRNTNKRVYQPGPTESQTSDSRRIRSLYLPFNEAMAESLADNAGSQALMWLDFSNNFGNPEHLSFANGELHYPTGYNLGKKFEQSFDNPFYSIVQRPNGDIEFAYVRYEVTNIERAEGYYDRVLAKAFISDEELESNTVIFSAIPLVANKQRIDLTQAIRNGIFQDLRHLFSFVPIKHPDNVNVGDSVFSDERVSVDLRAGVYFGLGQLAENDYEKAAQALKGPVRLSTTLPVSDTDSIKYSQDEMRALLSSGGYAEETDGERIRNNQPEEGKYILVSDEELVIFIRPGIYPHQLIGKTNDGNIFVQAIGGASGRVGISVKELFEYAEQLGLTDLMTISQGTGVALGYNGQGQPTFEGYRAIVGPSEERKAGSATINVVMNPDDETVNGEEAGASGASSPLQNPGGIDFNAGNLNLKEQGQAIDINFTDFPNIQANTVNGVTPIIINITPIANFPLLIGQGEDGSQDRLSQLSR